MKSLPCKSAKNPATLELPVAVDRHLGARGHGCPCLRVPTDGAQEPSWVPQPCGGAAAKPVLLLPTPCYFISQHQGLSICPGGSRKSVAAVNLTVLYLHLFPPLSTSSMVSTAQS